MNPYDVKWYPFAKHPDSDSCWSLSAGPDRRIYAAACLELLPGGVVKLARYNDRTDALDYLFDLDQVVEDPWDSGRATQCKIHYSFAPSPRDGRLYMATHLSGPPYDQPIYSPWGSWHDAARCFRGSALVTLDTRTDEVLGWDTLIPKEGCRCLAYDEERQLLYALSYPRDHLFRYDVLRRERRDLGRIGSVNAQTLIVDRKHRVWTTDDDGHLVRYDPDRDRLERSPYRLPHNPMYQTGWHTVFYDAAAAPDGESVFAVPWVADPHLMRIWFEDGEWGRVEDWGLVTQERDLSMPYSTAVDHCGGLTFGPDRCLYYVATRWKEPVHLHYPPEERRGLEGVVWRLNPDTRERTEVAVLARPDGRAQYVSRGAMDRNGDLFFGNVLASSSPPPAGIFRVTVPAERKRFLADCPLRMWG
jgi:hypothetical protein